MPFTTVKKLKSELSDALALQGYRIDENGNLKLDYYGRKGRRNAHRIAKRERIASRAGFIRSKLELIRPTLLDGDAIDIEKIEPRLVEVTPGSREEIIFRWWNLVWWSLPYEHPYGRQMRFLVWDRHHKAVIGLIGLQSPILSWNVRDQHLDIPAQSRDLWVNQSLSAQRLGAVPPYNQILGGKLVALLMTSDGIAGKFAQKYSGIKTIMRKRELPARLLFITTTGAYGKSSVYHRLNYQGDKVAEFIGYSQGSGSFHIPNGLFEDMLEYLDHRGFDVSRGFGSGPSKKLRLIDQALGLLGVRNGAEHGIQRAVYLFPFVKNLNDVISSDARPLRYHRRVGELTDFWKERWVVPRESRQAVFGDFRADKYLASVKRSLTLAVKYNQSD